VAFPSIAGATGGGETSNTATHVISLPASIAAGELLMVLLTCDGAPTLTWPASWPTGGSSGKQLYLASNGAVVTQEVRCRVATATEAATFNINSSSNEQLSFTSIRVSGWHGTTMPEAGTPTTNSDDQPDPPTLTPSWGTADNLWLVIGGHDDGTKTVSSYPLNFNLSQRNDRGIGAGAGTGQGFAGRQAATGSQSPAVFVLSAADHWIANTIAVRPTAATGGAVVNPTWDRHYRAMRGFG